LVSFFIVLVLIWFFQDKIIIFQSVQVIFGQTLRKRLPSFSCSIAFQDVNLPLEDYDLPIQDIHLPSFAGLQSSFPR
jgi:hypothetical protein